MSGAVWTAVKDWQTLITGVLALIAAFGTIWATIASANREVKAANDQMQLAVARERRDAAREALGFYAALEAVMAIVLEDVVAARTMATPLANGQNNHAVYIARQRVQRTGFADIRNPLIRLGGRLVADFLRLDKEIDSMAAAWDEMPTGGAMVKIGRTAGIMEHLRRIELQAIELRSAAEQGLERCNAVLKGTPELAGL